MHIESLKPWISHYRQENLCYRGYLPSDLSIIQIYNEYIKNNPQCACEIYRKVVKEKSISFTKLNHVECEIFEEIKIHKENRDHLEDALIIENYIKKRT